VGIGKALAAGHERFVGDGLVVLPPASFEVFLDSALGSAVHEKFFDGGRGVCLPLEFRPGSSRRECELGGGLDLLVEVGRVVALPSVVDLMAGVCVASPQSVTNKPS
jgi:hypothetical protein